MSYEPTGISVDVVLSGQHSTTVKPLAGGNADITFTTPNSDVYPESGVEVCAYLPGMQGPAGVNLGALGKDGSIQYSEGGVLTGANNFFYDNSSEKITISGGSLVINKGQFILSGDAAGGKAASFLIKDESATLINIDPQTKKITFSENASNNEYYIGIGHSDPTEQLHIKNGNLRVDGDIILSGNLLPTGGNFDIGSKDAPFRDLYLAGDSVVFPSQESKLHVSDNSITFTRNIYSTEEDLFKVSKIGDATVISGITLIASLIENTGDVLSDDSVQYGAIKVIPEGTSNVFMYFGKDLGYVPQVVCTLIAPPDKDEMYFFMIENIRSSGCDVLFSSSVEQAGYEVQCFASPRTGDAYFSS